MQQALFFGTYVPGDKDSLQSPGDPQFLFRGSKCHKLPFSS